MRLWVPCRIWTVNAERRMHWASRAELAREARRAGWAFASRAKLRDLMPARLTYTPHQTHGRLADVEAHAHTFKAVIDGLVDAGAWPDDTPTWVRSVTALPPVRGPVTGIELGIEEE